MAKLTNVTKDIANLNKDLASYTRSQRELARLKRRLARLERNVKEVAATADPAYFNNITFTWTGATTTISWTAGFIRDKEGRTFPVASGSKTGFSLDTTYWMAWNKIHKTMIISSSLSSINLNPNNLVIGSMMTGDAAQSGNLGGGGAEGGGSGFNGRDFTLFP